MADAAGRALKADEPCGPLRIGSMESVATALGTRRVAKPADLAGETLLVFPRGCAYRAVAESWFAAHGAKLPRFIEISGYPAILACVAAGVGAAFIPLSLIETWPHPSAIRTFPFASDRSRMTVVLAKRPDVVSTAAQAFWNLARRLRIPTGRGPRL